MATFITAFLILIYRMTLVVASVWCVELVAVDFLFSCDDFVREYLLKFVNLSCELTAVVATMKADGEVKHASAHKTSVGTMTDFDTPLTISDVSLSDLSDADHATSVAKRIVTVLPGSSSIVSKLSPYLIALRPWSFTASLGPVALGTCLAFKSVGVFNLWIYIATNICALSVHAAGNLVNTYVDFTRVSFIFLSLYL